MDRWKRFKKWCYRHYKKLALIMLVILIIIGIYPYNTNQTGGVAPVIAMTAARAGPSLARLTSKGQSLKAAQSTINPSQLANSSTPFNEKAKQGPDINIEQYKGSAKFGEKGKALIQSGRKLATEKLGMLSGAAMDKFRQNSQLIYEILYQIAFVIIILLIVFPMAGLFIISIVCFILLRNKLTTLKSL